MSPRLTTRAGSSASTPTTTALRSCGTWGYSPLAVRGSRGRWCVPPPWPEEPDEHLPDGPRDTAWNDGGERGGRRKGDFGTQREGRRWLSRLLHGGHPVANAPDPGRGRV